MIRLDERGKQCPLPVIEAKRALQASPREEAEVLVDNEIAVQNLQKMAAHLGYEAHAEKRSEQEYCVQISPRLSGGEEEPGIVPQTEPEAAQEQGGEQCSASRIRRGMVAVIASDCMGSGDETLGRLLMKGYLYALAQQDRLPQTVLLYNSGAYLSCQGSESLGDLKDLEAMGVEILTCGTCLNHYGLGALLEVGGVTNMYEIVERQTAAEVILRP